MEAWLPDEMTQGYLSSDQPLTSELFDAVMG